MPFANDLCKMDVQFCVRHVTEMTGCSPMACAKIVIQFCINAKQYTHIFLWLQNPTADHHTIIHVGRVA
jgi:hypothetical protein